MFDASAPRKTATRLLVLRLGVPFAAVLLAGLPASRVAADEPAPAETPAAAESAPADAPATSPAKAWDQAAVTALSLELAAEVKGVRDAFRKEPPPNIASGEARARTRLSDVLRQIESGSRQLSRRLEAGDGREATAPVFEKLLSNIRRAQDLRAKVFAQDRTLQAIDEARVPLTGLTEYYGTAVPEARKIVR